MKILKNNLLENLSLGSFTLYFIFNFIDRGIGNIFLLITLIICLINYKALYNVILENIQLAITIIAFSFYISVVGFYHDSPLNELDNYYRFLLLLPILLISLNESRLVGLIFICAIAGLIQAIYVGAFSWGHDDFNNWLRLTRHVGSSNSAITYGSMCATLFMISLYFLLYKNNKSYILMFSSIIFLILFIITGTRGPAIGIIIGFSYLLFAIRKDNKSNTSFKISSLVLSIIIISIIATPNPLSERLKHLNQINFSEPLKNNHVSLRERIYYIHYGLEELGDNALIGIGPQNLRSNMQQSLNQQKVISVYPVDHLHNDFLDIILKFGFFSIILLFFIYFYLVKTKNLEHRVLLFLIMIMLASSQITQSHFSHHQAITFFITLFYILQKKNSVPIK